MFTSESVTEGHPDKMCDQISDAILDAAIKDDPRSRVAIECLTKTGFVVVAVFWLMYGLLHKEKPLIMTYILWIVLQGIVVAGVVVYG